MQSFNESVIVITSPMAWMEEHNASKAFELVNLVEAALPAASLGYVTPQVRLTVTGKYGAAVTDAVAKRYVREGWANAEFYPVTGANETEVVLTLPIEE